MLECTVESYSEVGSTLMTHSAEEDTTMHLHVTNYMQGLLFDLSKGGT